MNKNNSTIFECTNCGAQFQKWTGRCLECGKWGTIAEGVKDIKKEKTNTKHPQAKLYSLKDAEAQTIKRRQTNIQEIDRVLGGGLVPGSLTLLGGEPGIGKSTLSLQIANLLSPTLYFSGEESVGQIKLRADRLKISSDKLKISNETNVESIITTIIEHLPSLVFIDSIQTTYSSELENEIGSINQIKACAVKLLECAKQKNIPIIIIGHITKDGAVAGPKTLEHLVDTVLYLEGDEYHNYRILRTIKNRFGSTDEVGIFSMEENGLTEIKNPSSTFLTANKENGPGNIITCLLKGTRPILIEVQALVNKTVFGYPVRKSSGFDINRLHVILAVLQKHAGLDLGQYDVYLNIVGGLKTKEPAVDLAVALAITSAYKDKPLPKDIAVFGEIGLSGEIRPVLKTDNRIKECENLNMKKIITAKQKLKSYKNLQIIAVQNIKELIKTV